MDNVIASTLNPAMTPQLADKIVTGQIVEIPEALSNFNIGDTLLLKVLFDNNAFKFNQDLNVRLLIDGQETPLHLKFDIPLKLEADEAHQILAKVLGRPTDSRISFSLISIDNKRPDSFILPPQTAKNLNSQSVSGNENIKPDVTNQTVSPNTPIIKEVNSAIQQVKFVPLKLAPAVTEIMQEFSLPPELQNRISAAVSDLRMNVELKAVLPTPQENTSISQSLEQEITAPLRQLISNIALAQDKPQQLTALINNLAAEVKNLSLLSLPATAQLKGENNVLFFQTPLGEVLPETSLKFPPQTQVILQLKEVETGSDTRPATVSQPPAANPQPVSEKSLLGSLLSKLVDVIKPQPTEVKPELNAKSLLTPLKAETLLPTEKSLPLPETGMAISTLSSRMPNSLSPLLDILKPLAAQPQETHVATLLLDKLPAPNDKMLSNLTNYVKAASTRDVSAWLGKDLVQELDSLGNQGKEVIARAADYVSQNTRDGISWRTVEIPLLAGSELSHIQLSIKKPQDEEEKDVPAAKRKSGTRFLLETEFTRLGKFQFDGFSLPKDRRFDLVIRTTQQFSEDFCSQIIRLFKTSLQEVDYIGNININLKENFIKIAETENHQLDDSIYI